MRCAVIILCLTGASGVCAAPEDPALADLRLAHQAEAKARQEAVVRAHVEDLHELENNRVQRGDYAGAERVVSALALLEKGAASAVLGMKYVLDVRTPHTLSGGATERTGSCVLTKVNGSIRWDGVALPPGRYEAKLSYTVDVISASGLRLAARPKTEPTPDAGAYGGVVALSEITNLGSAKPLEYKIPRTTANVEWNTVSLGVLTTTTARATLTLKATEAYPEGVMTFVSLELIPTTGGAAAGPTTGEATQFLSLQDEYHRQLKEKTGNANRIWLAKLEVLAKSATESGNTGALALIQPELARLTAMLNPTTVANPTKVTIPAYDSLIATFTGEVRVSPTKDCLTRIRPATARISFKLAAAKVQPGKYDVVLDISLTSTMGGDFTLTAGSASVRGSVLPLKASQHQKLALEKPLLISADAKYLELTVDSISSFSNGSLFDLHAIELTPSAPPP